MTRALWRFSWWALGALVAAVLGLGLVGLPAAQAKVGPRITIGVYGDSVAEGYTIPHYLRDSLVPQLRTGLAATRGFEVGGTGLIPVSFFRWSFNRYALKEDPAATADTWLLAGLTVPALDGPSGYSAVAASPGATATVPIDAPFVAVMFTKFGGSGVFTVTAGASTFKIDGRSSGPPTPTEQWITVPPGARTLTVHGPSSGVLILDGVIARGPVTPGHIGVEVENLGHMGKRLAEYSSPRVLASLLQQRFDVSVFLSGYLWELDATIGGNAAENGYARELRARVGLVRSYGGLCLIADSSPLAFSPALLARFAGIDRQVAREQGCSYTPALAHLWDAASAYKRGMTLVDDIHPTAVGYRLMTRALLPQLVALVRDRVRTRGR